MKASIVAFLAFACVIGVSMAQFNLGGVQNGGSSFSSFLPLLLLLLIFPLFSGSSLFSSSSSNKGDTTIIFGNLSGPTGGK